MDNLNLMAGYDFEAEQHLRSLAADARKAELRFQERCVKIDGGHFFEETTTRYGRCTQDGSPLPDGKLHVFTCYCGHVEIKYDYELERELLEIEA